MAFPVPAYLTPNHAIIGGITLVALLLLGRCLTSRRALPYPPGPRALPIIGNLLDMPPSKYSLTWSKYGEKYGPLTWLEIPGQNFLVINSFEAAKELLDKRTLNYIDRPRFTMAVELLGLCYHLSLSPANGMWKRQRALLKHALSGPMVKNDYSSLFEKKARQFIERCVARPEDIAHETNRIVGEVIVNFTYGKLEDTRGRDCIQMISCLLELIVPTLQGYVVDLFPLVRYLPKWLPGMKFKRDAAQWKREIRELEDTVFELTKENMVSDDPDVRSSFIFKRMQEIDGKYGEGQDVQQRRDDETALGYAGLQIFFGKCSFPRKATYPFCTIYLTFTAVFYPAGLETTDSTMQSFIYAMMLFPSVQKKAQAEIDKVVGSSRLPVLDDQPHLPLVHAVILETLRWNPVVPSGVPHVSRRDDVYDGYFIPKATTVLPNAWGFSRNPKYYSNPSTFDPERYLKQSPELDPREFVFGFGRRICPGKDLAFQEVWMLAAAVLWAFDIVGLDDELKSLADEDRFSFGMANHPTSLKCRFVPRREGLKDKLAA